MKRIMVFILSSLFVSLSCFAQSSLQERYARGVTAAEGPGDTFQKNFNELLRAAAREGRSSVKRNANGEPVVQVLNEGRSHENWEFYVELGNGKICYVKEVRGTMLLGTPEQNKKWLVKNKNYIGDIFCQLAPFK